jgi:hypothetical protein
MAGDGSQRGESNPHRKHQALTVGYSLSGEAARWWASAARFEPRRSTMPKSNEVPGTTPLVEKVKGKVKGVAGSVLGNEALAREGELHEAKAEHLTDAQRLDAEAAQQAEQAEVDARQRELEIEQQRLAAEEAADRNEARLESERLAEQARVDQDARLRAAAAAETERSQQAAVAREKDRAVEELAQERDRAARLEEEAQQKRERAEALGRAAES